MRLPAKYASNPCLSADWRLWKQPPPWLFSIWRSQALASAFFKPKWAKKLKNDLLTADCSYQLLHIYIKAFCPFRLKEGDAWIYPYSHRRCQKDEETLACGRFFGRGIGVLHHLIKLWLIIPVCLLVWSPKMYILWIAFELWFFFSASLLSLQKTSQFTQLFRWFSSLRTKAACYVFSYFQFDYGLCSATISIIFALMD